MGLAKPLVRVHTHPASGSKTIEGVLVKKRPELVLELADLIVQPADGGDEQTVQIEGRVHIPREHVVFWQVVR